MDFTYLKDIYMKHIGYKVMGFKDDTDLIRSGANGTLEYSLDDLSQDNVLEMEGNGVYLGIDEQYVLDYYSNLAEREILLKLEFDSNDITTGDITDKEPELSVKKVTIKQVHLIEDGEVIRELTNNKEVKMNNEINKPSGLYVYHNDELVTEREYLTDIQDEIINTEPNLYDLNDDLSYQQFYEDHPFGVDFAKERVLTIDYDNTDLQHSRVSLPNEEGFWDFEDCDLEETRTILNGLGIAATAQTYKLEKENLDYVYYKDKGELIFKIEGDNTNLTISEFKEAVLSKASWLDPEIDNSEIKPVLGEHLKHTEKAMYEIGEEYPDHKLLVMHNDEDRKAYATQVQDLTNDELRYGDFKSENGYLVNEESKTVILLPEKALAEITLFNKVKSDFDFSADKVNFTIKQDEGDINYLVRENNLKGKVDLDNKTYKVFEQKPSATGDATTAILLPVNPDEERLKELEISIDSVVISGSAYITTFKFDDNRDEKFMVLTSGDKSQIKNKSVFNELVESHGGDFEAKYKELESELTKISKSYSLENKTEIFKKQKERYLKKEQTVQQSKGIGREPVKLKMK